MPGLTEEEFMALLEVARRALLMIVAWIDKVRDGRRRA